MHQRLAKHIDRALALHSCVALPSVGGFITERVPATYDIQTGKAYPPIESIYFNAGINHRDGLLEASYAKQYALSARRARVMLEEDVRSLRADLVNLRSVKVGSLGRLLLSDAGTVGFEASIQHRPSIAAYGLHTVSMPLLCARSQEQTSQSIGAPPHYFSTNPATTDIKNTKREGKYFRILIPKTAVASAAVVLLLLALFLVPFRSTTSSALYEASFIPSEALSNGFWSKQQPALTTHTPQRDSKYTPVVYAQKPNNDTSLAEKVSSATASTNTIAGLPCYDLPLHDGKYYVIVATFRTEKQVAEHISANKAQDTSGQGVLRSKKNYRIFSRVFDNANEAYTHINKIERGAWVFHSK